MKIKQINEDEIVFDNNYKLRYYHEQDCCESVYADFEMLKNYNVSVKTGKNINIKEIEFVETLGALVEGVTGAGFNIISIIGEKFFVPCYSQQNGYYSSNLELILDKDKTQEVMDISEFVKDDIY